MYAGIMTRDVIPPRPAGPERHLAWPVRPWPARPVRPPALPIVHHTSNVTGMSFEWVQLLTNTGLRESHLDFLQGGRGAQLCSLHPPSRLQFLNFFLVKSSNRSSQLFRNVTISCCARTFFHYFPDFFAKKKKQWVCGVVALYHTSTHILMYG